MGSRARGSRARRLTWLAAIATLAFSARAAAEQAVVPSPEPAAPTQATPPPEQAAPSTAAPPARHPTGTEAWPAWARALFAGVSGGVGFAAVKYPELGTPHVIGPVLAVQLGYRVTPRWSVSLVYTDFQQTVNRVSTKEMFAASASFLRTAASCDKCRRKGTGGDVLATTFRLASLGPAFDVTPFGPDGLFLGASAGLAIATILDISYGGAATARLGYRFRPVQNVAIAVEGGGQGQVYPGGAAVLGYAGAEVRLGF